MKHLVLASLLFAVPAALPTSAESAPAKKSSAAPTLACKATGQPIIEIRHNSEIKAPTSRSAIYATGAWSYQTFAADGTAGPRETGCLTAAQLDSVDAALHDAPWSITRTEMQCLAYSPSYTDYIVRRKLRFTAQMCSGASVDTVTQSAISLVETLLPQHTL
jgi:hypothetical protein